MASSPALGFLLACAKAIEDGDLKTADWFLHRIMNVADKELAGYQNIVMKYFADALVRRAHGLHTPPSSHTWLLDLEYFHFHCYHAYGSWNISGITRDTIRNYLALMGKKRFHLIHISLRQSRFGETVLRRLPNSSDDPTSVRVTLLSPFLNEDGHLDYVKKCFHEKAKKLNIKVEEEVKVVCASGLGVVDDFKTREDEATVVFYNVSLSDLLKDTDTATGAMKTELVRLREINPALVFMLDFYANYDDFNFITYLEHSFQFYDNLDDEAFWLPHRQTSEGEDLNPIRRRKTLTEWKDVFLMAGFRQVPLTYSKDEYSEDEEEEDIEILREENECLVLGRKNFPILFLSAWKPQVENEHFNCHPDFDSRLSALLDTKIPSLQPHPPFPQGLMLNRLAAFVEIHDILEDLCGKYEISVALTWASRINESMSCPYKNHILYTQSDSCYGGVWDMSYPYKNHTLLIQSNYSYVKDEESYWFIEAYAEAKHIKAGQFIAVKALESSEGFHFEPSIPSVCVGDDEFLAKTKDYDIDAAAAICLQNCYTDNEVYVVEFFWEKGKQEYFAFVIIDEFKSREKKFVRVRVPDTGVGFQEKAISNILPLEEAREINGVNDQEALELSGTKPRKLRSKVWVDFDKFEVDGKSVAKCKHCSKEFSGSSKKGTSHLKNHLDRCPVKKKQNHERELICPTDTNERSSIFDHEKSRLDLAKLMIKHPYLLCDLEVVKDIMKGVQPMFEFQSKDVWLCDIHRIYREEKEKLKLYFDRLACKFHLTVNLWKNSRGKTTYCCLIAHFINDDWEQKRKFLSFKTLDLIYDAKTLAEIIRI